jgi:hypothetical protein
MLGSLAARAFGRLTGESWVFDPVGAGLRIAAVGGALAVGAALDRPLVGVLAAGGAFTVGFGAPLDLRGSHRLLLVVATFAIGASAVVGSLAARDFGASLAFAAALGAFCGIAAPGGAGPAWIALQCGLAGVVATSYPASPRAAAERAVVIVVGGLAQAFLLSLAAMARRRFPPPPPPEPETPRYPLQVALGLAAAVGLERALSLRNGYWVPLTTLLVLRPGPRSTFARGVSRTLGTLGGAAVASAILIGLHPPSPVVAALVATAAFGAYLFQRATYGLLSACVTSYVVFLLSFAGLPEGQVAVARIVATAVGAAIGLAVHGADRGARAGSALWRPANGRS